MRRPLLLTSFLLLASCASAPSGDVISVLRGRAIIQFEQHEFFECGASGRVLTIRNPEAFRKAVVEGDPLDVYYVVEGHVTRPGELGSVGVTEGILLAKNVTAMSGARLACFDKMRGN